MNAGSAMLDIWIQEPSRDFHDRLVQSRFAGLAQPYPYSSHSHYGNPRSIRTSSSMAPGFIHQYNASDHTPSLYFSQTHTDGSLGEDSVNTGLAEQYTGFRLLEDNNGVLEQPLDEATMSIYECIFWFLNCRYLSHDKEEWEIHCLSHFHGEDPPRSVTCPLCDWEISCNDGSEAWGLKSQHLASEHFQFGQNLRTSRPDFHLFHHLWQKRLIDDQDLKELKAGNHNLTHTPANFVTTNGRGSRRDRGAGRQRMQHVGRR